MAAYRPPVMTADSQVRSLPPVGNEPTATSVAPPGFAPRMGVTALPPVDDEPDAPNASLVAAVQNAPPNAAPTAAHPNVPTFTPGSVPTTIPPDINARLTWPQESDADHGFAVSGANHKNEPRAMAVEMPASVPASTMISQQPQPQTLHEAQPAPPHAAQQQPLQQAATAPMASQPTIIQANGVTPLPHSQNADIAPEVAAKVAKIGELLAQNRVPDAYEQLSQMYFHDEMTAEERQYVAKHLDQLAGGVLFSRRHHVLEPAYLVKDGDTAESIANQYKITPELLRKLNGIPNDGNVTAGTQLKILRGPLDARIYPGYHEMVVVTRGKYACRFPISVGSSYAGQEGNFTVQEKALNRGYQLAPGLEVIPPGDPANPLGSRWIELSKEQGTIGVHGTNMPEQIGTTRRSAGFFGLREQDIAEVYDMLTVGSNVTIVR